MKRALICLEKLGIGGVETFVITQIEEFSRRGITCYVLCQDGLLADRIRNKKNIKLIEFEFTLQNTIDPNKVKEIDKIIKKYKIDFIYVHQFPCILPILPCAFKYKVPYVAYLHNIVPGTLDWFMKYFPIYKVLFPLFFKNASKIIAITKKVKEEHQSIFGLDEGKYITIKNSLDFSKYPDIEIPKIPKKYKKLLLFGRVSEQKRNSIYTAVNFYHWCKENYNDKMELTVVGDGEIFDEIKEKYQDEDICFKGAVSDMEPEIKKADILLGVDRCILEAVASKKPSIICGYEGNTVLITPEKLEEAIEGNFGGYSMKDDKAELFRYSTQEIKDIISKNYQYIRKELSITNSVFLDIEPFPNLMDIDTYFSDINTICYEMSKTIELNNLIKEENEYITTELDKILNSRRWKIVNKHADIAKRIFKKNKKEEKKNEK